MLKTAISEEMVVRKISVKIIEIGENVSTGNDGEFRTFLAEQGADEECPRIVLDLSLMRFINSSGLGAIANLSMRLRKRQGSLVIISPNRELTQVFQVTKLDQVLNIVRDRDSAIAFFSDSD